MRRVWWLKATAGGADAQPVAGVSDLVLVQGLRRTRTTLRLWRAEPWGVLRAWLSASLAIAGALLLAVLVIGSMLTPDPSLVTFAGLSSPADLAAVADILARNALVLALHGFACVAGFIAGSSLPDQADRYSGLYRRIHDRAGPLAIAFVVAATTFSLITQALALGFGAASLAAQNGLSVPVLLLAIAPTPCPS